MSAKHPWDVKCLACNKVCCVECSQNGGNEGSEPRCEQLKLVDCKHCGCATRRHIRVLHYDAVPKLY
jgi:hypothetical protein